MAVTYEPVATHTLASSAANYTFSSIPSTYTDLMLVINAIHSQWEVFYMRFNDDTGSNYSWTYTLGNGSSVETYRYTNQNALSTGLRQVGVAPNIFQIMNYSNTTTYKTVIGRANASDNQVRMNAGVWRSTSAITSIKIETGGNFSAGTMFTLYGIKAA